MKIPNKYKTRLCDTHQIGSGKDSAPFGWSIVGLTGSVGGVTHVVYRRPLWLRLIMALRGQG